MPADPDVTPLHLAFSWVGDLAPVLVLLALWLLGLSLLREMR